MTDSLQIEIERRRAAGQEQLTVAQFVDRFALLGYRVWREDDCHCMAQYVNDGRTYPCTTTGLLEEDTRIRAFNVAARRDANYRLMQKLRGSIFAVTRGRILEV